MCPENPRGKELEPQFDAYYFGARYYNPFLARWISVDPMSLGLATTIKNSGSNYEYVGDSPYQFTDPHGLDKEAVQKEG